ncbi:cytochrome P450 monooxygenase-like protein [Lophiotrema nucula]|uniref:Cytochrome P450 monooxygenase-like protein n=1 Tax=Lophiotrema nucula TaxID=690887 RepID=A0A6A5YME2_9PLEO|nr:cytochrome P450 monooxygenase-like protein [Lophiotrema nucula]
MLTSPSRMALLGDFSLWQIFCYVLGAYSAFSLVNAFYYCFFHPLANVPGPWHRAAFFFPSFWEIWTGDIVFNWKDLHDTYGNIVRISPTCVSVIDTDGWRDIYGSMTRKPIPKDPDVYFRNSDGVSNIVSSGDADHTRMRRLLSHAFSEQALRSQESLINSYIDLLIEKLHKKTESNSSANLMRWLNYTTFDIIGDLCFGESFEALKNEDYNFWITNIFKGLKIARMFRVFRAYPIVGVPLMSLLKLFPQLANARQKHEQYTIDKTARRLDVKTDRKDFMSYILKHNDEKGMTREEIMKTSGIVIIAGSETSATLLSGAFYYLLDNPDWHKRLQHEIVSAFRNESEMTFASLSQLKILNAVIQETFRMYPPVPTTLPRLTTQDGAMVCGKFIPPNVSVGIAQYPAYRSSHNFTDPDRFAPERFLGDPKYEDDNRSIIQPFSVGPRNCIGQMLAQAEIRTILARLIWHFDMDLEAESRNWDKQKVFILWDKPSLMVRIRLRDS